MLYCIRTFGYVTFIIVIGFYLVSRDGCKCTRMGSALFCVVVAFGIIGYQLCICCVLVCQPQDESSRSSKMILYW